MGKRKGKHSRDNPFERVEPTPETRAKLIRDDWRLELNPDQQWACDRIRAGYEMRTLDVRVKVSDIGRTDRGVSHETPGEILIETAYVTWWRGASGKGDNLSAVHGAIVDPMAVLVREKGNPHQRWLMPSDCGKAVEFGYIEKALDEYIRITGAKRVDEPQAVA